MNTQELFTHAKEDLLADGKHAPIMYVEYTDANGKEAVDMYYFADFGAETPTEEYMQFFGLGAKFGEERGPVTFDCLTFIAEAWVSHVKPGSKRGIRRPADDPNKKEYLIAQVVRLMPTPDGKQQMKQSLLRAEIVRPAQGVVDLVEEKDELQIIRLLFPSYFLAGYSSSQMPPEQLAKMYKDVLKGEIDGSNL